MSCWIWLWFFSTFQFVSNSFDVLGDLNLNDVCCATNTGHNVYSKTLLLQTQQFNFIPHVFEPAYKSGSNLNVILSFDSKLFMVYVDFHLKSNHYPVSALLNHSTSYSESANNLTNMYPLSSFSSTHFNSHLSKWFKAFMALQNCSLSEVFSKECYSMCHQIVMDALNLSCKIKTTRRLKIP